MHRSRLFRTYALLLLALVALVAAACGGTDGDSGSATASQASSAANNSNGSDSADAAEPESSEGPAGDPFALLVERSDVSAEVTLASGGRLMLAARCLAGSTTATAILEGYGENIPTGTHVGGTNSVTFIVLDTDQPGRPAGFAGGARQTSFGETEYTYIYPTLGDATFVLPGCPQP